jgi:glutamyl/glutaminyl-tRNA synthetase
VFHCSRHAWPVFASGFGCYALYRVALLGWSFGDDRESFSLAEMVERFDISRVNPNPARFDLKKSASVNADWVRALGPADFAERTVPFLRAAGLVGALSRVSRRRRCVRSPRWCRSARRHSTRPLA